MASEFESEALDLSGYLRRIGHPGAPSATLPALRSPHLAHASTIPFENLDILLGKPIRLDMASLQGKLVRGGRGGYCFEHNLLFAAVLERVGFPVTRLAARVRQGTTPLNPRTHMTVLVDVDSRRWLCDVGFGGDGLLQPLPLDGAETSRQSARSYRVVEEHGTRVLQASDDGAWFDLYAFTLEPQHLVDYEMANYFTSTHPESRFRRALTAQLPRPDGRAILRNLELTEHRGASVSTRTLAGDGELLAVLDSVFGLHFPPGTRFDYRRQ